MKTAENAKSVSINAFTVVLLNLHRWPLLLPPPPTAEYFMMGLSLLPQSNPFCKDVTHWLNRTQRPGQNYSNMNFAKINTIFIQISNCVKVQGVTAGYAHVCTGLDSRSLNVMPGMNQEVEWNWLRGLMSRVNSLIRYAVRFYTMLAYVLLAGWGNADGSQLTTRRQVCFVICNIKKCLNFGYWA